MFLLISNLNFKTNILNTVKIKEILNYIKKFELSTNIA